MTKNYYRSEYSDKQWKALIDKATELGCQITYSEYGNIVTIDSTDQESRNAEHCLWAHDEQKQIDKMRELYDLLPVKPEWLTREQIDEYAARMGVK